MTFFTDRPLCMLPAYTLALSEAVPLMVTAAKPYATENGVAIVSVLDSLANREKDAGYFGDSYERLRGVIGAALADASVRGIVLDIDSPGGEASGAFELAAFIRASSARKPIVAHVDGLAASAGYAIASGAQEIITTPSSTLGSIGVVALHLDMSRRLESTGLTPTLLHAGAYKVDGAPVKPLAPGARSRIQATLDQTYGLFVSTVGKHRPALGEQGARKTEAGVYLGQAAVSAGLADRIGTRADAINAALALVGRPAVTILPLTTTSLKGPTRMLTPTRAEAPPPPAVTLTDFERGRRDFAASRKGETASAPRFIVDEASPVGRAAELSVEQRADIERGRADFAAARKRNTR